MGQMQDYYPYYMISCESDSIDITIIHDYFYMSIEAENIDSVDCDLKDNRTVMHGSDYSFKTFVGIDCEVGEDEGGLVSLEGNSQCDIVVEGQGEYAVVTSKKKPLKDIIFKSYIDVETYDMEVTDTKEYKFSCKYTGHKSED